MKPVLKEASQKLYPVDAVRPIFPFTLSFVVALISGLGVFAVVVHLLAQRVELVGGPNVFREEAGAGVEIFLDAIAVGLPLALVGFLAGFLVTMRFSRTKPTINPAAAL